MIFDKALLVQLLITALLSSAGCAASGDETGGEGLSSDDVGLVAAAVKDGWIFPDDDFNGIVRLWATNTQFDEFRQFCTGVLLTNDIVITARHCLDTPQKAIDYGWPDLTNDVQQLVVSTGGFGRYGYGVGAPAYAPDGRDLAVFKISNKLPVKIRDETIESGFFRNLGGTPDPDAYLATLGYGSTLGDATSTKCKYVSLQTGVPIPGCIEDRQVLSAGGGRYVSNGNRLIVAGLTATHGDSGGPTVLNTNGPDLADYPLVGINASASACSDDGRCGADVARTDDLGTWFRALADF